MENIGQIELKLEPPSVIRIRVVDVQGKPVSGATCASTPGADTVRSSTAAPPATTAVSRGKNAPSDAVLFDIFKTGFMRERLHPFTASAEEQFVVSTPN